MIISWKNLIYFCKWKYDRISDQIGSQTTTSAENVGGVQQAREGGIPYSVRVRLTVVRNTWAHSKQRSSVTTQRWHWKPVSRKCALIHAHKARGRREHSEQARIGREDIHLSGRVSADDPAHIALVKVTATHFANYHTHKHYTRVHTVRNCVTLNHKFLTTPTLHTNDEEVQFVYRE